MTEAEIARLLAVVVGVCFPFGVRWDRSQNRQHSRSHERQRPVVWFEAHI
jgi:hypothetical protein